MKKKKKRRRRDFSFSHFLGHYSWSFGLSHSLFPAPSFLPSPIHLLPLRLPSQTLYLFSRPVAIPVLLPCFFSLLSQCPSSPWFFPVTSLNQSSPHNSVTDGDVNNTLHLPLPSSSSPPFIHPFIYYSVMVALNIH